MRCPTYGSRAGAPRAQNRRQAPIKWASELRLRSVVVRMVISLAGLLAERSHKLTPTLPLLADAVKNAVA
jgi:hypothetical protein